MTLSIKELIIDGAIETLMQLVISPNKEFASGIEALSRGIHPITGELITPTVLFSMAEEEHLILELEELMFHKALETFKPIYDSQPELLLFINLSPKFIERCIHTTLIEDEIDIFGIPPSNIFFDINPFKVDQLETIKIFVDLFRAKGFYICIDDLCIDYNNIDKVLFLAPDLIKINIKALRQIKNERYGQRLIHMLKLISENMGIIMVGKGIENESDLAFTLECGAQFMQGYFISKPVDLTKESLVEIKSRYRILMEAHVKEEESTLELSRMVTANALNVIRNAKQRLHNDSSLTVEKLVKSIFENYPMIENMWLLDDKGKQTGMTWINRETYEIKNISMFQLHHQGSDFSTKEIFTKLYDTILDTWVTPPFKSILTGNICVSCSTRLDWSPEQAVLCLNLNVERLSVKRSFHPIISEDEFQIVITSGDLD